MMEYLPIYYLLPIYLLFLFHFSHVSPTFFFFGLMIRHGVRNSLECYQDIGLERRKSTLERKCNSYKKALLHCTIYSIEWRQQEDCMIRMNIPWKGTKLPLLDTFAKPEWRERGTAQSIPMMVVMDVVKLMRLVTRKALLVAFELYIWRLIMKQ